MHRYIELFFVNAAVVVGLFILNEFAVRVFIPQIQIAGTEYTLLIDSVYNDSPGLNPNSTGTSNGVLKEVDGNGFWAYSKKSTSNDTVLY